MHVGLRYILVLCALCLADVRAVSGQQAPEELENGVPLEGEEPGSEPPSRRGFSPEGDLPIESATEGPDAAAEQPDDGGDGGFVVLPGPIYSQETSLGVGILAQYSWFAGDPEDTRPSAISLTGAYTLRSQWVIRVSPVYFSPGERWVVEGDILGTVYPYEFFGVGMDADGRSQAYTEHAFELGTVVVHQLAEGLFVGGRYLHQLYRVAETGRPPDGALGTTADLNSASYASVRRGSYSHGLGPVVRYDRRDSVFAPASGRFYSTSYLGFSPLWGSRLGFGELEIDAREYREVADGHILALQVHALLHHGDVPFERLSRLGGMLRLRGVYEGRFLDDNALQTQFEYRFPIAWRFRGAVFFAAGQVTSSIGDFGPGPWTWTSGGGLRFVVDPETRLSIRLDYGIGPDGSGVIFQVNEAF